MASSTAAASRGTGLRCLLAWRQRSPRWASRSARRWARSWDAVPPPQILAMMARLGMTFEARLAQVGDMHRAGVALIAGADSGINPAKPHGVLPESIIDM